jgi:hypothetical protein
MYKVLGDVEGDNEFAHLGSMVTMHSGVTELNSGFEKFSL